MLLRRAVFSVIAVFALGLPILGCGHQVTPERIDTNLAGKMVIQFATNGPTDFTNLNYVVVFNTCGVGGEPYPGQYASSPANFSYVFAAGANFGGAGLAEPALFQYVLNGGTQLNALPVAISGSTTQFIPDISGQGTEFQITFTRAQLNNPLAQPYGTSGRGTCPNGVSATPSPNPSASPTSAPQFNATTWYVNFFTIDTSNHVLDSLGIGGANDTTENLPINVTTLSLNPLTRPAGAILPSNPSAQIAGGAVNNYP